MLLSKFLADTISFSSGSVKIPLKSQIDNYRQKYEALIKRAEFRSIIYRIVPSGQLMVHVKVPSQSLDNFFYDVVLELTPNTIPTIEGCDVRFFSNSPSFVYGGYAYIFHHMDTQGNNRKNSSIKGMMIDIFRQKVPRENLLIPHTANKLGKDAVTQEPEIRNPMGLAIPDSSIYFAIFHILDTYRYSDLTGTKLSRTEIQVLGAVANFDKLMLLRKYAVKKSKLSADRKQKRDMDEVENRRKQAVRLTSASSMKTASRIGMKSSVRGMRRPKSTGRY